MPRFEKPLLALFALRRIAAVLLSAIFFLLLNLVYTGSAQALGPGDPDDPSGSPDGSQATPTPLISPRQEQPLLPENPTMADLGHQTWWAVCMACHGDAGQGLTDEWRQTAFGEDMDCWTSKCHGPNHPPEGFVFPRIVPPAWGPGTLKRFVTADELQAYLTAKMPWWKPGSLSEEEAWQLAAFVLQGNGVLPEGELDINQASLMPVHLPIRETYDERLWQLVFFGVLGLAAAGSIAVWRLKVEGSPTTKEIQDQSVTPPKE
jgi:mono/diheme cytochrome c family protein